MRALWLAGLAALCLGLSLALSGTAGVGRLLLGLDLPRLAAPLLSDHGWHGAALYRAGDFAAAAKAFRQQGRAGSYNLGNALTMAERYAAALEAFDIARLSDDPLAAANFDLVAAHYSGLALDPETPVAWFTQPRDGEEAAAPVGEGSARAAATGDEVTNSSTILGLPELIARGQLRVRKVFDDRFMVADQRWLATLADVPGEYLAARIAFERKRRAKLGLAPPEPADPD